MLGSTAVVAVATLLSRVTGFAKQVVLLAALGTTVASSYTLSTQIPNMVSELLVGAVLTAVIVPMIVRAGRDDADHGELFIRRIFTLAATMLALAAVLFTVSAPFLVRRVFLPGDTEVSPTLTTALTYLIVPALFFYGISALLTSVLNTREVFAPGAWAPVLNNVTVLTVFASYVLLPGDVDPTTASVGDGKVLVLGLGTAAGVIVQTLTLIPAVRAQRINLRPAWGLDRRLASFGLMATAVVVYVLISQIGLIVSNRVAAGSDAAGPAIYASAWLLLQLPYGILGVTVLTVLMPRLSRHFAEEDAEAVIGDLSLATRTTLLGMVPAAVFFTAFGSIIVEVAFAYGKFDTQSAALGHAVSWSAFTLVPYALVLVHLRYFYAAQRPWTPTWIILGITTVKVALSAVIPSIATSPQDVAPLLGAVNGVSFTAGALIGWLLIRRSLGAVALHRVRREAGWLIVAAAGGLAVSSALLWGAQALVPAPSRWVVILELALLFISFVGVTAGIAFLGRVTEVRLLAATVFRRLSRSSRPGGPDENLHETSNRVADYAPGNDDATMGPVAHPTQVIHNVPQIGQRRHGVVVGDGRYRATTHVMSTGQFDYWDGFDRATLRPVTVVTKVFVAERLSDNKLVDHIRRVDSFQLDGIDLLIYVRQTEELLVLVFQSRRLSELSRHEDERLLRSVRGLVRSALIADAAGLSLRLHAVQQVRFDNAGVARVAFPASETGDLTSDLHTLARATLAHLTQRSRRRAGPPAAELTELATRTLSFGSTRTREEIWSLVSEP